MFSYPIKDIGYLFETELSTVATDACIQQSNKYSTYPSGKTWTSEINFRIRKKKLFYEFANYFRILDDLQYNQTSPSIIFII